MPRVHDMQLTFTSSTKCWSYVGLFLKNNFPQARRMGIGKPTTGGCITAARKPRARNRIFRSENLTIIIFVNSLSLPQIHFLWLCRKNIAKGTTDPRVEFISQVQTQILIKFHLQNLDQASTSKSQPNINLSIKLKPQNLDQTQLQNLDQDSTSTPLQTIIGKIPTQLNLKFKILTKPSFRISTKIHFITSTKHQLQNNNQTRASKSCLNFKFKILTKPFAQYLKLFLA